jgi:DNA replication protein DnaC
MSIFAKCGQLAPSRQIELDCLARRQAEQDRRLFVQNLIEHCGVWPKYQEADLNHLSVPKRKLTPEEFKRYTAVRDELKSLLKFPGTIVLSGANGPGKTHLGSALVHAFCAEGRAAYYCTALDFFRKLKSTFGAPGKTAEELILRFRRYECLVLDEIDVRNESEWENNELRDLFTARDGWMVSTVAITNRDRGELVGSSGASPYLSPALLDRMRSAGAIITCDWPSLRGETQTKE